MITLSQSDRLNSIDHERALIAHGLHGPEAIDRAAHIADPSDFVDTALGTAWRALLRIHAANQLTPYLDRTIGALRILGVPTDLLSISALHKLHGSIGTPCFAPYHAGEIRRLARLRRLVALAEAIQRDACSDRGDPDELTTRLRTEAEALDVRIDVTARPVHEIALETVAAIRAERVDGRKPGAMTGLLPLDQMTGGVRPGELCVVGGRPSSGKTSLAMQVAEYSASKGRRTMVVSLEMRDREILERLLTRLGNVDSQRMRQGQLTEEDFRRLESAAGLLEGVPLVIWQHYASSMALVRAAIKLEHAKAPLALVVIDYLQLIGASGGSREQRTAEVGAHSKALKNLAGELDVPLIVCAQLNRSAENAAPTLASMGLSDEIVQDADSVWLLHSERREDRHRKVAVAKARNGSVGSVTLGFEPEATRFTDAPAEPIEQRPTGRNGSGYRPYQQKPEPQRYGGFDKWNQRQEAQEDF